MIGATGLGGASLLAGCGGPDEEALPWDGSTKTPSVSSTGSSILAGVALCLLAAEEGGGGGGLRRGFTLCSAALSVECLVFLGRVVGEWVVGAAVVKRLLGGTGRLVGGTTCEGLGCEGVGVCVGEGLGCEGVGVCAGEGLGCEGVRVCVGEGLCCAV